MTDPSGGFHGIREIFSLKEEGYVDQAD